MDTYFPPFPIWISISYTENSELKESPVQEASDPGACQFADKSFVSRVNNCPSWRGTVVESAVASQEALSSG